jgi:sodium/bile acid cotransporter 7
LFQINTLKGIQSLKKNASIVIFAIIGVAVFGACSNPDPLNTPLNNDQVLSMYESYRDEFPGINEVSVEELKGWMAEEEIVLIDVREDDERAVSIIEGAITKKGYESDLEAYSGKKIVAYCTIGYRSGLYVKKLKDKGIDAYNLQGSILAWVNAGMPLQDESGNSTNRVHVYGKKWNIVPNEYEGVW